MEEQISKSPGPKNRAHGFYKFGSDFPQLGSYCRGYYGIPGATGNAGFVVGQLILTPS